MNKIFLSGMVLFLALCSSAVAAEEQIAVRVLWIGNSSTRAGDMPALVDQMLQEGGAGITLKSDLYTPGGKGLEYHVSNPKSSALTMIQTGKYDVVVIQPGYEDSMFPGKMMTNGVRLIQAVRDSGAVPVLFSAGLRKSNMAQSAGIFARRAELARTEGCIYAPCGEAWQVALQMRPDLKEKMFVLDAVHPTAYGVYMSACVFYTLFSGKSPVGLEVRAAKSYRLDPKYKEDLKSKDPALLGWADAPEQIEFDGETAGRLQSSAWVAVRSAAESGLIVLPPINFKTKEP